MSMIVSRADMLVLRSEYLSDSTARDSMENDAEAIKISVLIANNNGFTIYKSLPTIYEESRFNFIIGYLTNLFADSSVTAIVEEDTGKKSILIDWSEPPLTVVCEAENKIEIPFNAQ